MYNSIFFLLSIFPYLFLEMDGAIGVHRLRYSTLYSVQSTEYSPVILAWDTGANPLILVLNVIHTSYFILVDTIAGRHVT